MADNEAYDGGDGSTYSQLLFDVSTNTNLSDDYSSSTTSQTMLCFGKPNLDDHVGFSHDHHQLTTPPLLLLPKSETTSSASSNNLYNIKREHKEDRQRSCKKNRSENVSSSSSSTGREKVRREKLGERVAVLQQLVSPYGKTDTASVLHEAMGYIRFLHEQVQVLCSPYLQTLLPNSPFPTTHNWRSGNGELDNKQGKGGVLRSKGLCLIPLDCTLPLANQNGADLWTPSMVRLTNNNNNPHH